MIYLGQPAEEFFIFFLVQVRDEMSTHGPGKSMLNRAFDRTNCLRPEAVVSSVPKKPGMVCGSYERHGPALCGPHALCKRQLVRESRLRVMAGCAGDLAVSAETFVKEDFSAQCYGFRIVSILIGRIFWEGRQGRK